MSDLIGQSLGRYHILEQLGEGGMAVVYKAYDTRLEADVAVKVIRVENLTLGTMERALKRFEREAKALAKLNHQNIVNVTDYGEYESKPYLVMPYFPGGTLKQKLGKAIPWQEAVEMLLPIAEALDYAHSQKMVHRDVKPANILLTERGQPMLTDFGIAKVLDIEETMELTGTSAAVGTPEYMAPEQATAKTADHRADIYALGIVLYEMITGRKPYSADTPMAVLIMHARDPLPRPSNFVSGIPNAVEKVLIKALAKSPDDRYHSMAEMVSALEGLFGGKRKEPAKMRVPRKKKKKEKQKKSISKPRTSLKTIIIKAAPFFRMAGIILIVIALLWAGSWVVPKIINTVLTANISNAQNTATDMSPTIISSTKTPRPSPTKTKIPSATPRSATFSNYDNFSSESPSKSFDTTLWLDQGGDATIKWQDGYLVFSGTNGGHELQSRVPSKWDISEIGKLQADLRIDSVNGTNYAFTKIGVSTNLSDGKGTWWAQCRVGSYDGINAQIICDSYRWDDGPDRKYQSTSFPIDFGVFYSVAIELASDGSYVRYYVDGKEIGSYQPAENDLLIDADFTWSVGIYIENDTTATGAVDNVAVGN